MALYKFGFQNLISIKLWPKSKNVLSVKCICKRSFPKHLFCLVHNVLSPLVVGSGLDDIDGLVQGRRHSIANALELLLA